MPEFDKIEFIRSRLATYYHPELRTRIDIQKALRGRMPPDDAWACAVLDLLDEIDRLRAATPATSTAPAPAPGAFSCVQFKAELSAAEYAEALTQALAGDASLLIAAFEARAPYHDAIKAQPDASALSRVYRRRATEGSLRASLKEQTR